MYAYSIGHRIKTKSSLYLNRDSLQLTKKLWPHSQLDTPY